MFFFFKMKVIMLPPVWGSKLQSWYTNEKKILSNFPRSLDYLCIKNERRLFFLVNFSLVQSQAMSDINPRIETNKQAIIEQWKDHCGEQRARARSGKTFHSFYEQVFLSEISQNLVDPVHHLVLQIVLSYYIMVEWKH